MAAPVSGAEFVARLSTLEAFMKVLVHGVVQRHPEMKDEILDAMKQAAAEQAKIFGRIDVVQHVDTHTNEFLDGIRQAIGATS